MRFRRTKVNGEDWMVRARLALGEVSGAVEDMLRPHAQRELGPAIHRRLAAEGLRSLWSLIESAPDAPAAK